MNRLTDAAWRAILHARGNVQGKIFRMSSGTMFAIQSERGQDWHPEVTYFLYGIRVSYDERKTFGHVSLERP